MGSTKRVRPDTPTGLRPVVLFDGGCPLCRREIAHYRRLRGSGQIDWIDIVGRPEDVEALGISPADAMARLHVRDRDGAWHTGVWGFAELWRHLPRYRVAARLLSKTGLLAPLDFLYSRFARWRLHSRCESGACARPAARGGQWEG